MEIMRLAQKTPEVSPETSVMAAVTTMKERNSGAVAVTVGGKIVGVFTERDLMLRVVHARKDPDVTLLSDVMTSPVLSVPESTSAAEAATLMQTHKVRHLAIVDTGGKLLGMLALRHSLGDLLNDLERKVSDLEGFIMADGPGG